MTHQQTSVQTRRRQELIEAAIAVIATEGIAAASIDRIVAKAGQSKGSALYHIQNKQKLYEMVVAYVYADAAQNIMAAIAGQPTPAAKIETYIRANLRYIIEHPQPIVAVQKIVTEKPAPTGVSVDQATLALQKLLQLAQADGEVRSDVDSHFTAVLFRQAIDAASYYIAANPKADLDAYADSFVNIYMHAIKTSNRRHHA